MWLFTGAVALWGIASWYLPLIAPFRPRLEHWVLAVILVYLAAVSLAIHQLAHLLAARYLGNPLPAGALLYPFGDAAQKWVPGTTPGHEVTIALAGPIANGLLAFISYLAWKWPYAPELTVGWLSLFFFNAALTITNLAPGYPLDGGRLTQSIVWHFLGRADWGHWLAHAIGRFIIAVLLIWAFHLLAMETIVGLQSGAATALLVLLLIVATTDNTEWQMAWPESDVSGKPRNRLRRGLVSALLILLLAAVSASIMPTLNGLYMPGEAVAVEPMLDIPEEYRHPYEGRYFATTVIIQTPIMLGQLLYAYFSPFAELVPPSYVVPEDRTPAEVMQQNVRMLEESETVAAVLALQQAGFNAGISTFAAEVTAIRPNTPAQGLLEVGDRIVALDDQPVSSAHELVTTIASHEPEDIVFLRIIRNGRSRSIALRLAAPLEPEGTARLGIEVETTGAELQLPFPVRIETKAISGGPSAGFIFALATYDLVTPGDLLAGRRIAGTGTIRLNGEVGPIGGVAQKVAAAERTDAEYFLAPVENAAAASAAARHIKVIPIHTFEQAIDFLNNLPSEAASSQEGIPDFNPSE